MYPRPAHALCTVVLLLMTLPAANCLAASDGSNQKTSSRPFPRSGFEVGQLFPEIVLPSAEDSRPLTLAQFRGKKTILHIFASW